MKERTRKFFRAAFFLTLFAIVVFVVFIAVLWLKMNHDDAVARVEIQKRLDAIRATGEPLTAQDLAKLYPDPPPEHDAVLSLKPALDALVIPEDFTNIPFFNDYWPSGTAPIEKPALDEIQTCLDKDQKAFDSVPWEKMQGAWIGSGFENGFTNLTEAPVSKINSLVKLFCVNAILQTELQNSKEAVQSLQKALVIGNIYRNDTPVHGMSKIAARDWVGSTLERIFNRTKIADDDLISLSDFLISTNLETAKEFTINERCFGLFHAYQFQSLANQAKGHAFSPVRLLLRSYESRMIYRDQDLLNFLEWNEHCLAAIDLPLSNAIPTLTNLERNRENLTKNVHSSPGRYLNTFKKERFSFLTPIEFPPALLSQANAIAQIQTTRTAIAIERWRLAHKNSAPNSLNELVPDFISSIPTDPFDGQPLHYKKLSQDYVVYSIGPDFTDDGGKEKSPDAKESDHYDITFKVER